MTLSDYVESLKGKRVAVVGVGVSNLPLLRLLAQRGVDVTAHDKATPDVLGPVYDELSALGVKWVLGDRYLDELDYDLVFRTPGLHPAKLAPGLGVHTAVTSEMEAFFALCPCRTIAITGSDGKTTTSTLIAKLLEAEGYRVHLGGNIGHPLLCDIPDFRPEDFAVLELSSFQLHGMQCSPDVAVVTNLAPNHLDVHPSFEDYAQAKQNIYLHQKPGARLVLNLDNAYTAAWGRESGREVTWFSREHVPDHGYCFHDGVIWRDGEPFIRREDILLPGLHNVENYMTAFAATDGLVSRETCLDVARSFTGVEHRIQLIRTRRGVRYYNDSIASSPSRTTAGLRSFDQKVILIAGGHDKHIPFDGLAHEVCAHVKALFLVGETAEAIRAAVLAAPEYDPAALPVTVLEDFRETVLAAAAYAREGDVVILSPACSSFDKFKNFVERGNTFRAIVEELEE